MSVLTLDQSLNYQREQMDKWIKSDDTDTAHQYADDVLTDLIAILKRHANVTEEQSALIDSIVDDFEQMDKWYA